MPNPDATKERRNGEGTTSEGERIFETYLNGIGRDLPRPERNYQFLEGRKFTADFCWPLDMVIVEIDGGNRMARMTKRGPVAIGRHTQEADYWKLNYAVLRGWKVLRFTPSMLRTQALDCIEQLRQLVGLPFADIGGA